MSVHLFFILKNAPLKLYTIQAIKTIVLRYMYASAVAEAYSDLCVKNFPLQV